MRDGKLDLINLSQWLIAGASLLLLLAIFERDNTRDELAIAQARRASAELQLLRERDQHRDATDQLLDEINRLKAQDEPSDLEPDPDRDRADIQADIGAGDSAE